jgi:Spy/CpxP family protein refolding chaperone
MKMLTAAAVATMVVLAGCAAAPQTDDASTMQEVAAGTNTAGTGGQQMTGSRLKRDSTERMLKAVGAQGARDEMNNAPRPLNSGG